MGGGWKKYRYPAFVGLFTLAGIVLLLVVIFTLGGQRGTFMRSMEVHALFQDVGGLKKGDQVWLSGVRIGVISEIQVQGRNKIRVTMAVQQDMDSLILSDSRVRIGSDGVMGNRIIIIFGGTSKAGRLGSGGVLLSEPVTDTHELVQQLASSGKDLSRTISNLSEISESVRRGEGTLGMLVGDSLLADKISGSVSGIHGSIGDVREVLVDLKRSGGDLSSLLGKFNESGNLVHDLATDTALYDELHSMVKTLRASAENTREVSRALNSWVKTKGSVADLLMKDTVAGRHMESIISNLDSAALKLDEDLKAVQESFLLRRYFRRKSRQ